MYVTYGHVDIILPYSSSLKEKRKIIQSIISRVRKRFNISISEVDFHELWQRSRIGFSAVCNSYSECSLIIDAIRDTFDLHVESIEITDFIHEIISS